MGQDEVIDQLLLSLFVGGNSLIRAGEKGTVTEQLQNARRTAEAIVGLLQDGWRVALAAPTGKAAARLQEAVANATREFAPQDRQRLGTLEASTLHRLLGTRRDLHLPAMALGHGAHDRR